MRYHRPALSTLEPYSAGRTLEEARRESGLTDIVKLSANENPYGASPRVLEAMSAELALVHMYPWNRFTDLKDEIGKFHGLTADNVVVGHGSEAVMQLVPMMLVEPGDEVIVPAVSYTRYAEVSKVMGARILRAPMTGYDVDVGEVVGLLSERTRIVWIGSPNNPTGRSLAVDQVRTVLEALPEDAVLVLDQAYQEYADDQLSTDGAALVREGYDNLIETRTFSKAYALAGIRLGYGVAHQDICELLDRIKEPFNLNRLSAVAGPIALHDREWLARCVQANAAQRAMLTGQLAARGLAPVPSQANFVLVDVGVDADELFNRLMAVGVLVRPATAFGYPTHIRVTVGTDTQNRRFLAALDEVLPRLTPARD